MSEIRSAHLDIQTKAGVCDCYVALPATQGPHPVVIVLMDAFGPREHLYAMTRRLAENGYFTLLPNLFYRKKKAPLTSVAFPLTMQTRAGAWKDIEPLYSSFKPEEFFEDMSFYLKALGDQKNVDISRLGLTGYCMGGGLAMLTAARFPQQVRAVASFHAGRLVTPEADSPHRALGALKAPIYVAHADQDASMTSEQIEIFNAELKKQNVEHKAELYVGALHGFTMADLPAFNAEAAERHWRELLSFFGRYLVSA